MGYIIVALSVAYMFWIYIANADIRIEKIHDFLQSKELNYNRHRNVRRHNMNFENGETFLTFLMFWKKYYEIDATDSQGNPVIVVVQRYQSVVPLLKNRIFFQVNS